MNFGSIIDIVYKQVTGYWLSFVVVLVQFTSHTLTLGLWSLSKILLLGRDHPLGPLTTEAFFGGILLLILNRVVYALMSKMNAR